jgi:hypothetical protein
MEEKFKMRGHHTPEAEAFCVSLFYLQKQSCLWMGSLSCPLLLIRLLFDFFLSPLGRGVGGGQTGPPLGAKKVCLGGQRRDVFKRSLLLLLSQNGRKLLRRQIRPTLVQDALYQGSGKGCFFLTFYLVGWVDLLLFFTYKL